MPQTIMNNRRIMRGLCYLTISFQSVCTVSSFLACKPSRTTTFYSRSVVGSKQSPVSLLSANGNNEESKLDQIEDDEEFAYQPGAQVFNALIADLWTVIGNALLKKMRSSPTLIDPYLLKLKGGRLRYAPTIQNIELISPAVVLPDELNDKNSTESLPPPRFAVGIVYRGTPDLEFVLTGADGYAKTAKIVKKAPGIFKRLIRVLVPDITVEIKSIYLRARLEAEIDLRNKRIEFFFVKTPIIDWDLEFSLTKVHIPLVGEDSLDTVLTNILGGIDRDHPISIKF